MTMELDYIELVGFCAAGCSTFSSVPQIIKIWKSRSVQDISLLMFMLAWMGTILWMIYGVLKDSSSLVVANLITSLLVFSILVMKIKFDPRIQPNLNKT